MTGLPDTDTDMLRRLLRVQQDIGRSLFEFPPADAWLEELLALIGHGLGFEYGAVWRPARDRKVLERDVTWTEGEIARPDPAGPDGGVAVGLGEGVVGQAWQHGHAWTVLAEGPELGAPAAALPGLRGVVAFALRRGELDEGVMEFAITRTFQPSAELLSVFDASGALIAQFLDRLRLHDALVRRDRALRSAANALVLADARRPHQPVVYANAGFERLTGYSCADVEGRSCSLLQGEGTDPEAVAEIRAAIAEQREARVTLLNYRKDGRPFWNDVHVLPVRDDRGQTVEWVGVMDDVTSRVLTQREFSRLAYTDSLTGLANRALLTRHLGLALARARRHGHSIAVFLIDVDDFKRVNDSFGHASGDDVLREIAHRLRRATRESDLVARQGGDEFFLLVTDLEGDVEPVVVALAEKLEKALAVPYPVSDATVALTPSIGVSVFPTDASDADALLARADAAMYEVKRRRRHTAGPREPTPRD